MTFEQWQARYSGIRVEHPYPEAPEVCMITDRLIPGGPLQDLQELDDYKVTVDMLQAHYGPTVWLAPKVNRDDWTRNDYMCHRCSHEEYYESLVRLIGKRALTRLVLSIATPEQLARYTEDPYLNSIPLARWDALDPAIRQLVSEQNKSLGIMARTWNGQPLPPNTICWSLSESVCVAKSAARMWAKEHHANP